MRNKIPALLIAFSLNCTSYGATPESQWLGEAVGARFSSLDEVGMNIEKLASDFSDAASISKLKTLLLKLSANPQTMDSVDTDAGRAAFQLLAAVNAPGLAELALPILRNPQHPLRSAAAQAAAVARDDRAVDFLEQAALGERLAFAAPAATRAPEILQQQDKAFDFLRCLALIGSPKARAAFDRASSNIVAAAESSSASERDRVKQAINQISSAVARPEPAAATTPPATPASPLPAATPEPTTPAPLVAESPAPIVERKSPVWPWVVGIVALVAIVAVALKRRA